MRRRLLPFVVLGAALAALAFWRILCVRTGPDVDTDAYAHHMIARAILADPSDLAVHWVWLPLFHYVQVPLIVAGGTMETVRWVNVALTALLPVLVFRYVRRACEGAGVALLAALLTAANPIAMQMGTTAQPEPLFAVVMFLAATAFQERRSRTAAAWLGVGVMLRYEAWASLAAAGAFVAFDFWRSRMEPVGDGQEGASRATASARPAWIVVAAPAALILAWAALRRPVDGRWFGFLGQTRAFATDATHQASALDHGIGGLGHDLLYYPVFVAARVMGPATALVPFGIARTLRQQGARFVALLAACLAFVTLTWILRSSLGLDRHFVVDVALYAIFAAQGVGAIADAAGRWAARIASREDAAPVARHRVPVAVRHTVAGLLGVAALAFLVADLSVWMTFWRGSLRRGWPDRVATGAYLRSLPPNAPIFCDEATLEILSGLDRRRFDRHWIDDPHTWDIVAEAAREHDAVYVATWSRKLVGHEADGNIVFQSPEADGADPAMAVMRVVPDAARALR